MGIHFNICTCYIYASLSNYTLLKYITNRYISFVTDNTNFDGMTITDISQDVLRKKYGLYFSTDNKDAVQCKMVDTLYVNYVSDFAVILYDKALHTCYVCLQDDVSDNYIYLVGVQICNIIMRYLTENDIYCVHSSVVTFNKNQNDGIMFIGESGAGKTSLAYEFLRKGEQITNDDVAFICLEDNNLNAYKNTQYIGMDDVSISKLYPECTEYIIKKDGLTLDKNRIDLSEMYENAFATNIVIKRIVLIDKNRGNTADLSILDCGSAYSILFKAIVPFLPKDMILNPNIVDIIVSKKLPLYRLTPANTAKGTVDFLYDKFRI